ncbi:hypothetical protein [Bacteriovorax sp. Seq25_V]|uniref:hypothetical protein n=1 Tax=Bacteriovorax sp. Seq25_V TaxID=1201288 RepID=UPI000389EA04|nr:hypothetical protein [Bacteriovorax sp. Seq25_V]EQC43977.1 hypothetical protein M900_1224 [Bacteriovorax sp. Seq25_V]
MNNKKQKVDQLITNCSMVFKSYLYEVVISKNKANLWHFTASKKDKKYVVYCAPDIAKVRGIIKVALKKIPGDSKLVVICNGFEDEDSKQAEEFNYSILTISTIKQYGTSMIEARTQA